MAKGIYIYGKRDLLRLAPRDLSIWKKRPVYMAKEAYKCGKTDLSIWKKRPFAISMKKSVYMEKKT
jgi:hypothetical protein